LAIDYVSITIRCNLLLSVTCWRSQVTLLENERNEAKAKAADAKNAAKAAAKEAFRAVEAIRPLLALIDAEAQVGKRN
jgi:hypothetical protein